MTYHKSLPLIFTLASLSACQTVEQAPVKLVNVEPTVIKTCTEISALTRVEIPAETETFYAITEIENPGYEPIQRKETQVRVIKEAETIFVNSEGREVTDICETEIDPNAATQLGRTPGT